MIRRLKPGELTILEQNESDVLWKFNDLEGTSRVIDGVAVDAMLCSPHHVTTRSTSTRIQHEVNEWLANEPVLTTTDIENAWKSGYLEALTLFAHWKDGVQYVGTCGRTLKQAKEDIGTL